MHEIEGSRSHLTKEPFLSQGTERNIHNKRERKEHIHIYIFIFIKSNQKRRECFSSQLNAPIVFWNQERL